MKRLSLVLAIISLSACSGNHTKEQSGSAYKVEGLPEDFDYSRIDQQRNMDEGFYYNKSGFMVRLNQENTPYISTGSSAPDMAGPNDTQDILIKDVETSPIVIDLEND